MKIRGLWDFYDLDMRKNALSSFNFSAFSRVDAMTSADFVDYEGSGEVLDIIATPTNEGYRRSQHG